MGFWNLKENLYIESSYPTYVLWMKNSFNLLGVFKDVKIAVAGSTRSVHPSEALDLNKFRKSESIDEGKCFHDPKTQM